MYYRYATRWRSPAETGPEFALDGDHFAYVFPSDAGVACLAVSVPLAQHAVSRHDPGAHLTETFRRHPQTSDRTGAAVWEGGVYVGLPADSVWRESCGPGWALVGDAGTAQDPWAGLGMDTAARQAEAFVAAFTASPGDWHGSYDQFRRERTYAGYDQTTRLARDLRQLVGVASGPESGPTGG
jgi:flavin-dependent dehydrogenase